MNSGLAAKSKGFCQTLDHGRDDEISRQLDHVRSVRFLAGNEYLLTNRVQNRTTALDRFGRAAGNNPQLPGGGDIGPTKDWRSNIVLFSLPVCFGQTARQGHADRLHGNMTGAGSQRVYG